MTRIAFLNREKNKAYLAMPNEVKVPCPVVWKAMKNCRKKNTLMAVMLHL